jgi:hypothetical protein
MYNNSFFKKMLVVASIVLLYSCDKDYNEIGGGLIGDNHFDFVKYTSNVIAYNQNMGAVQTDNLNVNRLGIYDDPAFGKTTANFATQLILDATGPEVGSNAVIDSVYITVPYFSTLKSTDEKGAHVYELDSIYGAEKAKMKLSVYESGFFMRDLDPEGGFQNAQKYYSNQNADFDNVKVGNRLNDFVSADGEQNDSFFFDPKEIVETSKDDAGKVTTVRSAPAIRLKLSKSFFDTKILKASKEKLASNDAFKEYFRGLYFKMENADGSAGSMAILDFKKGKITIKYKEDTSPTDAKRVDKTIVLNLTGNSTNKVNTVNLLSQTNVNSAYASALSGSNSTAGDEKLFIKGGEGSMAVLDLFDKKDVKGFDANGNLTGPNGVSDELDDLRFPADGKKLLINEANLVFHIDKSSMATSFEPNRIFLYDLTNNRPLIDYYIDESSNSFDVKKSKYVFDGMINKENVAKGRGVTYKLRITNQIRVLVKNADSTNVKLGLVITEDIAISQFNKLRNPISALISQVPRASVMSPLGTVLFGNNIPAGHENYDKRLKLEIFYTKPN